MSEKFEQKKSLGQNFLNSDYIPKKMCEAANLQAGETVLEIGPGTGALTKELLARGAKVVAIEADARAISTLEETFQNEIAQQQLSLHHHDAREIYPSEFNLTPLQYKVVANIPYYLSGLLFRSLLDTDCQPNTLVFLVQKEVGERIARDQKESLLSMSVKVFGTPHYITTVKKGHFSPPPKVDSAIIAVNNISQDNFKLVTPNHFFHLLHLGFGQKRKQLVGNLSREFNRLDLEHLFSELNIEQKARAEDLTLKNWLDLASKL
ncbi:ribosomal RNA small subunit methyltransferase A [Candidatus Kaiserbacteria bacterium]|nr:ribosomal RNA small subunit methyltransferase A [Candidatus Kaiserbacteria bacterium]